MASSVFKPTNGVNPKKIPAATPTATARGESSRLLILFHRKASHWIGFTSATLARVSSVENPKHIPNELPAESQSSRQRTGLGDVNNELRTFTRLALDGYCAVVGFNDGFDQA